ncbi:hypothetical protein ENBRE01_2532 [Enteropsectra breve]|nr:hypothetical protein ENBRE01_2532 [Enteropsectra breve]
MEPAVENFYQSGKMVFFHTLTAVAPLAFFLIPVVEESLGKYAASLWCLTGCVFSAVYGCCQIGLVAAKKELNTLEQTEETEHTCSTITINILSSLLKYFNFLVIFIFYCYIASVYFYQFAALFPLSNAVFQLVTTIVGAAFGLLLYLNRRYSGIQMIYYFSVMLLMILGTIWIKLLRNFYVFEESEGNYSNNAFSLSPSYAAMACVFMFCSVRIPNSYLYARDLMPRVWKFISMLLGILTALFFISELRLYSTYSAGQFFISAANYIIDRSQYFTEKGEFLFSTGSFIGPFTLGLFSLYPVLMMINEAFKRIDAMESEILLNNTEPEMHKYIKFSKRSIAFFIVIVFLILCPILVSFSIIRNFFLQLLIVTSLAESCIFYPWNATLSFVEDSSRPLFIILLLLTVSGTLIFMTACTFSMNKLFLLNDTTTIATTVI